jgi:hypothetical protein
MQSCSSLFLLFAVWGPPLSAQDFYNGQQLLEVTNVTEETRQAIKTGIQSEALHRGEYFYSGLHPRMYISRCSSPLYTIGRI